MTRPYVTRVVCDAPASGLFKPAGVPLVELEQIQMTLDEYEALHLVDGQGMEQAEAADLMEVSRPTVTRILSRARGKLARMLSSGAALRIEGGPVRQCPGGPQCRHRGRGQGRRGRGG